MKKASEELGEFSSGFGEFAQDKSVVFKGVYCWFGFRMVPLFKALTQPHCAVPRSA